MTAKIRVFKASIAIILISASSAQTVLHVNPGDKVYVKYEPESRKPGLERWQFMGVKLL